MKYSGSATTSRFTYTTDKHIFLLNNLTVRCPSCRRTLALYILTPSLQAITTNWALGAELLYSVAEAKPSCTIPLLMPLSSPHYINALRARGAVSVGLRYLKREGSTSDATTEFTIAAAVPHLYDLCPSNRVTPHADTSLSLLLLRSWATSEPPTRVRFSVLCTLPHGTPPPSAGTKGR
jgi:hypothetical protein